MISIASSVLAFKLAKIKVVYAFVIPNSLDSKENPIETKNLTHSKFPYLAATPIAEF